MANIYSLQLLRNGSPFTSYTAAVNAITGDTTRQDGVLKLARYTSFTETSGTAKYNTSAVKTVFGLYYKPESGEGSWTVFDSYHEVIQNIQDQIDSLTGGAGSIAQQIEAALGQLDFSGVTGNVVTGVEQTNGKVSATGANVGTLALTGYEEGTASGHVEASDSINAAFAKLQNQIDAANDAKDAAIEALDANITAENGSYIDHIEQVDGKISGTTKELPTVAEISETGKPIVAVSETKGAVSAATGTINAEYVNVTGNTFTSSTVQGALEEIETEYKAADQALKEEILGDATTSGNTLGKLEDRIEALDADAKEYSIKQITTGLSTNVKEAWGLFDADNHQSGATINIYKDSAYKEIYLGTAADTINTTTGEITKQDGDKQSLNYAYMKADGTYDLVKVDVSAFLSESEFQSGVTAVGHIVRGVVDPTSESFLTVGENGFKLAGVQAAIDAAVSGASDELQDAIDELSGKAVTSIASADGSVTATKGTAADGTVSYDLSTDASKVKVSSAYTAGTNTAIATGDTVDTALAKLEAQIAAAKAEAKTKVEKDAAASHITLSSSTAADGSVTYTIGENDIASKTALDAEIAARKAVDGVNGDAYTADTNAHYINNASNLYGADQALDTALYEVSGKTDAAQAEINAIESAVGLGNDGTYAPNTTNTYTSAATSVADAIDKLDAAVEALDGDAITGVTVNNAPLAVANNVASQTVVGKQSAATATNNEAIVVETDATGNLTLGIASLDAGTY